MENRRKRFLKIFLSLVLMLLLAIIYSFGPYLGALMVGKPVYLIPPSPERYGRVALDFMETMGIYAGGEDWTKAREKAEAAIAKQDNIVAVNPILEEAIAVAGGKHSFIRTSEEQEDVGNGLYATTPAVERWGEVLILSLPGFIGSEEEAQAYADVLVQGIDDNRDAQAVVVDLRENDGGDMGPMIAGLSPLLPDGELLYFQSRQTSMPVSLEDGISQGGGTPLKMEVTEKLKLPVAILQGPQTGSSGEATLLAFKGLKYCRFFGLPTAGYASANTTIPLYGGHSMFLTTAKNVDRTGAEYAEEPIPPDQESVDAMADALRWLSNSFF